MAGLARTLSDSSHSGSTLAPAEARSATTSCCLPWFPAGGSHHPWIAHPRGGDLYFSSLRFKSAPSISLLASRSSPSSAAQCTAVSPHSPPSSGLAPPSNNPSPPSSPPRLAAPLWGVSPLPFLPFPFKS